MSIKIVKYNNKLKSQWDQFVDNSDNGTLFHKREFLNYHIEREFKDHSLLFYIKNQIICVMSAAEVDSKHLTLYSHPGASYGGFVFKKISFRIVSKVISQLEHYLKIKKISQIFLVPTPPVYANQFNETIEYVLKWNQYRTEEIYISSIIKIDKNLYSNIHRRKKRYINRGMKNSLSLSWTNDYDNFYPILLKNKLKHGVRPTHSLKELKILSNKFPKNIKLLMLYKKKIAIGGTLIFVANQNVAIIFYNMIDYSYSREKPALHLIAETMNWAYKNKIKWLDFGVSQLPLNNNPLSPHKSLIQFKEQFGATGFIRKAFKKLIT